MTPFSYFWIVLLLIMLAGELIAYYRHRHGHNGETLSENIWLWFSLRSRGPEWRLRRFAILSFLVWLSIHWLSGGQF